MGISDIETHSCIIESVSKTSSSHTLDSDLKNNKNSLFEKELTEFERYGV